MTSVYEDRTLLVTDVAIKGPCRTATTAAITLNGEQTIDGVACIAGDRVLVKAQTSSVDNGIYLVSTGTWTRASDFQGARAAVKGALVKVNEGTAGQGFYYVSTANPITIGSSAITFAQSSSVLAVISAFAQTLLDDADALTARQTLLLDKHGADIASAATVNLDNATGDLVDVTGVVAITAITLAEGVEKTIRFTGALTLTNGASLVLPGAANITTAAGDFAVFRGYAAGVVRCVRYSRAVGFAQITNSLGADVALNNSSNFFDGPSVAQGTAGIWFASGTITALDTASGAQMRAKLWDGTTVIASGAITSPGANSPVVIALSGFIVSPAGNLRISVQDAAFTTGVLKFNVTGTSKDSTITAIRIG